MPAERWPIVVRLQLAFVVGFCYLVALWLHQDELYTSVPVLVPFWFALLLRAGGFFALLLYLAYYLPKLRIWLLDLVLQVVESEDW